MKRHSKVASIMLAILMMLSLLCTGLMPAMAATEVDTSDYEAFVANLKVLEDYSHTYVQNKDNENEVLNVINYIRTGVAKYTTSSWTILAGDENKAFTQYVAEQDALNGTTASALKDIHNFSVPNGNDVDFAHMFGSMDVAYYSTAQGASASLVRARADLASWAGDVCDLMLISNKDDSIVSEDTEEYIANIYDKYLGQNYDYAMGRDDIYGDLDAFYILDQLDKTGAPISTIIENYFTEDLTDELRVDYFLKNRFDDVRSRHDIRLLVYRAYKNNNLLYSLESSRSLQNKHELRMACCYAFADYLFNCAGDADAADKVSDEEETEPSDNDYYSVFSSTTSNLAPGIKQDINYALTKDNKQIAYYIATVDMSRDDVSVYSNYHDNDPSYWAMARVTDQMAAIQAKHTNENDPENYIENFNTIVGVNGDFYNMTNGKPSGVLVMDGVQYNEHNYRADRGFFAILKDGSIAIGSGTQWDEIADQAQEAIGGSLVLIQNGEIVNQTTISDYYGTRAPRTAAGVTADGKLILMALDGRQEPFSAGGNFAEIAQIMLDAGCVEAINLDGGGSTTFAAKQEGDDHVSVVNRPSDGYERSVSSSLVVVSTAVPSNTFDHVNIETDTDYLTVNSALTLTMNGVSVTGNSAEIPDGAQYRLSDDHGHITDDVFYADREGEVTVDVVVGDEVIGTKTLYIVQPDRIFFTKTSMDMIYGRTIELPISATYNSNPVTINPGDIFFQLSNNAAGTFDGFNFTASENSGLNNITVTALLNSDFGIKALFSISLYDEGAAVFDFENAMQGSRLLAWNHYVSNSTTYDNKVYYIKEPGKDMTTDFTFAIDARAIPFPAQLVSLVGMVAGSDVEGVTPWNILLQLAERVSPLTEVTVTLDFEDDMDIDYSDVAVINDYFYLKNATVDEATNTLIIKIGWYKQSEPIKADTANPICILDGIKVTPKDDATWNSDDTLVVPFSGNLHYDIGLRATQLYNMTQDPAFGETYGIYNYVNPDDPTDKGGHMPYDFLSIEDTYQLDKRIKQGWEHFREHEYYFVDNEPLTGYQYLPSEENPEKSYYYDLGEDGALKGKVNGMFEVDGATYYAINGERMSGWWQIADENGNTHYYYFNPTDYKAVDGNQTIDKYHYVFENKQLKYGEWITDANGTKYMWAGKFVKNTWIKYDDTLYFARPNYYLAKGAHYNKSYDGTTEGIFYFDETTGEYLAHYTGFYTYNNAKYYMQDGKLLKHAGLIKVGEDLYYINSSDVVVCGKDYFVSNTNDLIAKGTYHFDEEGRLVQNTEPDEPSQPDPTKKNGLILENGELYYYVNDVKTHAGLIKIDGDYYYIKSNCTAVRNCDYFISDTNDLMPRGTHHFDADGKMADAPSQPDTPSVDPTKKNGLILENGELYYYVNDVKTHAGLIKIDGSYYYIKSNCTAVRNCDYFISNTNDLMPRGTHHFDADGRMTDAPSVPDQPSEPTVKNGLVEENGQLYYYVNDVKTHAGLIKIDGYYYYIKSNCTAVRNCDYFISDTNDLMPRATHHFDADGRMTDAPSVPDQPSEPTVKNGLVEENGQLYYYVNGVKTHAGLIVIDGNYYYIKSNCTAVRDCDYFISDTNDLMPRGIHHFDADGRMVIEN